MKTNKQSDQYPLATTYAPYATNPTLQETRITPLQAKLPHIARKLSLPHL